MQTDEIPYNMNEGIIDIAFGRDGDIYLAFFQTGRILRIACRSLLWHTEFLPGAFGNPGGVAVDSRGRLPTTSRTCASSRYFQTTLTLDALDVENTPASSPGTWITSPPMVLTWRIPLGSGGRASSTDGGIVN
jgi:hypothetical protein